MALWLHGKAYIQCVKPRAGLTHWIYAICSENNVLDSSWLLTSTKGKQTSEMEKCLCPIPYGLRNFDL